MPCSDAPSLVCLDRITGKLLWKDNSPGKDILHGQWSSPAYADEPVPQVIHGQGDGWLRAFDPDTGKLLWKFDCNRRDAKHELGGHRRQERLSCDARWCTRPRLHRHRAGPRAQRSALATCGVSI